ncbi:MAG: anti-sigma factor [Firmicutes bacterium]|nr:anti-sigma factor [Bacillota bacterium]
MSEPMQIGCDALVDYLIGELSPEQMQRFSVHLTTCVRCRLELEELQPVHDRMAEAEADLQEEVSLQTPIDFGSLKQRTLDRAFAARPSFARAVADSTNSTIARASGAVREEPRLRGSSAVSRWRSERARSPVVARVLTALAGVAVVAAFWSIYSLRSGPAGLLDTPLHMEAAASFPGTSGMLMMAHKSDMMQLTLTLQGLPPAPSAGCFELWVVTPNGRHIGYGEFVPNSDGWAKVTALVPMNLSFVQVGVTREPSWGDKKPLGKMVLRMHMPTSV